MVFNKNTQPIDYVMLLGFGIAGYLIGREMMREKYWILYPSTSSHRADNDKCRALCSDRSGELYDDCIDDCNMGGPLADRHHPSRTPDTHGNMPIAFFGI